MRFEFNIFVPGKPLPLGRPRVAKNTNGLIKVFTPKINKEYQAYVGIKVKDKMNKVKTRMSLNKMSVKLVFHTYGKCDLDNLVKGILDAMNGILYKDDGQVVKLEAEKIGVKTKEECGVEIWAWEVE